MVVVAAAVQTRSASSGGEGCASSDGGCGGCGVAGDECGGFGLTRVSLISIFETVAQRHEVLALTQSSQPETTGAHRDDDASDGERAGADEASLVPYTVRVAKPPRFEDLGVHRLPKNTACGETIEVERGWFIVHRVTTMYNLVRGKYEKDGRRLDVRRAERFFVNAALEAAYRADDAVGRGRRRHRRVFEWRASPPRH